jgi:hypothetical protein
MKLGQETPTERGAIRPNPIGAAKRNPKRVSQILAEGTATHKLVYTLH